jgi:beta-galactosidase
VFEFAWSVAEPEEGRYDFSLFDRFLSLAEKKGMKVILCTPTATPPAWLTGAHPEVLNAAMDGTLMHHGHRRHYNYNSPVYLDYTRRIVTQLAERYGDHPAVVGWQIDNEINCECDVFYSDADRAAFRQYLKDHFKTLDALNDAIGARFWNQTYTDWAQVDLEKPTLHGHANPHMALLEKRFFSKSAVAYVKLQADILRKHIGNRFVTTNGIFGHLDTAEMTQTALDFITYDSYPNFAYGVEKGVSGMAGSLGDRFWSYNLTNARSYSPNFGVMEQQSGANGWDFRMLAPMPKPGQITLWAIQSFAHGADYVGFFRWRTCAFGTEIYWHGINDYGNVENRRVREVASLHETLKPLKEAAGSRVEARVALLCDYLNEWDGERDLWHGPMDQESRRAIFAAAQKLHTGLDFVHLRFTNTHKTGLSELTRYPLIFYPHPTILTEETAHLLTEYVKAGGILVMGARTGYKDEYGRCPMMPMPGFARALTGAEVVDYTLARAEEPPFNIDWGGDLLSAPHFQDVLTPVEGGEALARFTGGYFDGEPALIRKTYPGGGAAYYLGSGFSEDGAKLILKTLGFAEPHADLVACPEEVELSVREKGGARWIFLLNYTASPQEVALKRPLACATTGETLSSLVTLPAYSTLVLRA